ncbi:2-hydroxychromene-2-carboxylate isomerase [Halomonas sp. MCCC 1A11057]|jgi:2-hydroxychromene-2-carboxylate isomerase|uniref:2-hydroxychromene-2-carboxylate isomerase n=1 Tax=Halomonas sp. MCCC 1A11057 TaxID=2733482 RepID=UPI001F4052A3|nr:2-hydroxychromene-2-carboxylate isomerase [Halomonas sp. MCCC 1A11057]MCE8031525.1 2-hydroxychromene-2-carboxylate isomerase [Halomonas sp. MCCC 1A11057]
MTFTFWFEFASTYSYPAAMRLEHLAAERDIEVRWQPFLLGPIFQAQGWNDTPFKLYPAKGRYMWRDIERICERDGIRFRRPSQFPRNGLLAARIANWHAEEPWVPAFVRSVFRANFEHDEDIADPQVIANCLAEVNLDAEVLLKQSQQPEVKASLREATERAQALDIFGAPFFMAGDEPFWGYDRMEQALDWYEARMGEEE